MLAIDPTLFGGSIDRLHHHLSRLHEEFGVSLPAMALTSLPDTVELSSEILRGLKEAAE